MIFVFYNFPLPLTVLLLPCPTAAPASLNVHVVSTNFAKTLVFKREDDVTNSAYPVKMATIRYCSILEFGRGHPTKQSPRASQDLFTPLIRFKVANHSEHFYPLFQGRRNSGRSRGSKRVEENDNFKTQKKSLPIMLVFVQRHC